MYKLIKSKKDAINVQRFLSKEYAEDGYHMHYGLSEEGLKIVFHKINEDDDIVKNSDAYLIEAKHINLYVDSQTIDVLVFFEDGSDWNISFKRNHYRSFGEKALKHIEQNDHNFNDVYIYDDLVDKSKVNLEYNTKEYDNALILDLNEDQQLVLINRIIDKDGFYDLNSNYFFTESLRKYVLNKNKNVITFKNTDDKIFVNIFLEVVSICSDMKIDMHISENIQRYLRENELPTYNGKSLGMTILERADNYLDLINDKEKKLVQEYKEEVNKLLKIKLNDWQAKMAYSISNGKILNGYTWIFKDKTQIIYSAFAYLSSINVSKINKLIVFNPKEANSLWQAELEEILTLNNKLNILNIEQPLTNELEQAELSNKMKEADVIFVDYQALESCFEVINNIIDNKTMVIFNDMDKLKNTEESNLVNKLYINKSCNYKIKFTGIVIPNPNKDLMEEII